MDVCRINMEVRLVGFHPLDSDSDYDNGNVEKNFIKLGPGARCSKIFFDINTLLSL